MGLFLCPTCNQNLGSISSIDENGEHKCNPVHIKEYIELLLLQNSQLSIKLSKIEDSVKTLITSLITSVYDYSSGLKQNSNPVPDFDLIKTLDKESFTVNSQYLKDLWNSVNIEHAYYSSKEYINSINNNAISFLARWIALHQIVSKVFILFKSKRSSRSWKQIFENLLLQANHIQHIFNYEDSILDLSVEDVMKSIKEEV